MKRIYLASMLALLASMPSAPVAAQAFGNAIAIDGGQVFVGLRQIAVRAGLGLEVDFAAAVIANFARAQGSQSGEGTHREPQGEPRPWIGPAMAGGKGHSPGAQAPERGYP